MWSIVVFGMAQGKRSWADLALWEAEVAEKARGFEVCYYISM